MTSVKSAYKSPRVPAHNRDSESVVRVRSPQRKPVVIYSRPGPVEQTRRGPDREYMTQVRDLVGISLTFNEAAERGAREGVP